MHEERIQIPNLGLALLGEKYPGKLIDKYKIKRVLIQGKIYNLSARFAIKVTEEDEGSSVTFPKTLFEAKAMVIFDPNNKEAEVYDEKESYYKISKD